MTASRRDPAELETILDYRFRDDSVLIRALSHSSLKKTGSDPSYERLEFLGDRVLGLAGPLVDDAHVVDELGPGQNRVC